MRSEIRTFSSIELKRRLARSSAIAVRAEARLDTWRTRRLACGLSFVAAILIAFIAQSAAAEAASFLVFLICFVPLVRVSRRHARFARRMRALEAWYARQVARREGRAPFEGAVEAKSTAASDLSLEGPRSLLALLDETWTDGGREALRARVLASTPSSRAEAQSREDRVRGLSRLRWSLARIGLDSDRTDTRISSHELKRFCDAPLLPAKANLAVAANALIWALAIAVAIAFSMGVVSGRFASLAFVGYAILAFATLNSWGPIFLRAEGFAVHLSTLSPLLEGVERLAAAHGDARELAPRILAESPSRSLKRLERALAFASIESNPIVHAIVNAFVPWSVFANLHLESTRARIARGLPGALDELHEFEAWSSLALYASTQGGAWPEHVEGAVLDFDGLAHPLLAVDIAVPNGLKLEDTDRMTLLTGSNMAGKSTFLRAVGLNQILANLGAPTRSTRYRCGPLAVETCIQIADSLTDGVSYFYAEVLRLKEILAAAGSGRPTLALIDEIFRGTNNRERRAGSEAVIRALLKSPTTLALVSTHDLELAGLEGACPGLTNRHFRDDVKDGRLSFDFRLRPGPCPTTNALRLMRREGLPVPGSD